MSGVNEESLMHRLALVRTMNLSVGIENCRSCLAPNLWLVCVKWYCLLLL